MNLTIFNTPVLKAVLYRASRIILGLAGWRIEGRLPPISKFVLVGAPHTSNWDLPYTLLMAFALRANIHWLGKEAIFRRPFRGFFRWLGGIPVKRSQAHNLVEQSIQEPASASSDGKPAFTISPAVQMSRLCWAFSTIDARPAESAR